LASKNLGLSCGIENLQKLWKENEVKNRDFRDFEAALLKLGKDYCRKKKHDICPIKDLCKSRLSKNIFLTGKPGSRKQLCRKL